MTTQFWSTPMDHNATAGFRTWGAELKAKLAAAGLVQTADTGQIDWTTVARPAVNANAGYEIWRFNDTQQATAPIYMRIDYGTETVANYPRMQFSLGTGTNGAGTLTGTFSSAQTMSAGGGITTGLSNFPSYLCVTDGFFGLAWKTTGSTADYAWAGVIVCRSSDTAGTPDARGAHVLFHSQSGNPSTDCRNQSFKFTATAQAFGRQQIVSPVFVPGNVTSSLVGSDFQMYLGWMTIPQVLPIFGIAGVFMTELALGVSTLATLIGSTPRTYIQLARQLGQCSETASNDIGLCMLWE